VLLGLISGQALVKKKKWTAFIWSTPDLLSVSGISQDVVWKGRVLRLATLLQKHEKTIYIYYRET
jgi:hypothetical protein